MAIAFRSAGTVSQGFAVTSISIPKPTGTTNGDFLIMATETEAGQTCTPPAGWTALDSVSSGGRCQTWYRVASSEPASYTVSVSASTYCCGAVLAYTGTATTPRTHATASSGGATTSPTPGLLSGMVTGDMGVICYGYGDSLTTDTLTGPGGTWTNRVNIASAGVFDCATLLVADKLNGSDRPTATASTSSGGWSVCSIALAPAGITVSPTGIASAEAFGTTVVTRGQTVSPTGIASAEAFGTTTVTVQIPVFPTGIATASAMGTPTVSVGTPLPASGTIRRFDSLTRVVRDTRTQSADDAATALARLGTHTHSTAPNGLTVTGAVVLSNYSTGGRPSASTSGAGAAVYDTTLSKPVFSDGVVWRDAAGAAV